jgi:hypothetical protein
MADEQTPEVEEVETEETEDIENAAAIEGEPEPEGSAEGETEEGGEEPPEAEDPFAEFGGLDQVKSATAVWERLGTEDGLLDMFINTAKALDIPLEQVQALFDEQQGKAPVELSPEEEEALDEPVTARQLNEAITKALEQAQQPVIQDREERQKQVVQTVIDGTFDELKVAPEDRDTVLAIADKFVTAENYLDPQVAKNAVRRAAEEFKVAVERKAKEYLQSKRSTKKAVPSSTAASTAPGGEPEKEPQNLEEAQVRARARLRAAGEIV